MTRRRGSIRRVLLAVWAAFAVAHPGLAVAIDCSSPPRGYGGSWFRDYQDWCSRCGGTPSATANPPKCTPGPNWGGKGAGGQAPGIGAGIDPAAGFQRMLEDYARGTEEEKLRMMGVMDRESRERAMLEEERARAAAERERQDEEARRTGALHGLKGIPGGRDLTPKAVPLAPVSGPRPPLGSAPPLLRDAEPRGHRIVDCGRARETRGKLAAGLPVQREAIERTRAQLVAARDEIRGASEETRKTLVKAAKDESVSLAKKVITSTKALRLRLAALKEQGLTADNRRLWLAALDSVEKSAGNLEKLGGAGKAGYAAGVEFRESARNLSEDLVRANKLFVESGIAEQIGETLAESAGSPLGALVFRAARLSIDVGVAHVRGAIGEDEYRRALDNLDTMQTQYNRSEDEIKALDADLARYCRTENPGVPGSLPPAPAAK